MKNLTKRPAQGRHQLRDFAPELRGPCSLELISARSWAIWSRDPVVPAGAWHRPERQGGVGPWAEHRTLEKALLHMKACQQKAMMM